MSLKSEISGPDRGAQPQKLGTSIKGGDVRFRHQKVGTSDFEKRVGTSPQVGTSEKVGTSVDVPTCAVGAKRWGRQLWEAKGGDVNKRWGRHFHFPMFF